MDEHSDSAAGPTPPEPMPSAGEARFRAVVEGFSDPILITDAYQIVRYVNLAFLSVFGYRHAEVIGRPVAALLPPADGPVVAAALASAEPARGTALRLEHALLRSGGEPELVETSANALSDPSGHQTLILHMRVITAHRRAEAALRASEQRYRHLIENGHDLIQSVAPDGSLRFVNRAWLQTLGYSQAEVPQLTLWDVVHPDSREECEGALAALWHGQDVGVLRPLFVARDGTIVELEGVAVAQAEPGQPANVNAYFRDVTAQNQNARVQATRFAVTRILADSPELDIALARTMEAIAANLEWQAAELWLPEPVEGTISRRDAWQSPGRPELAAFAAASRGMRFALHEGLPGRAWAEGEVFWEANLGTSPTFRRAALAAAAGLRTAVAVPIVQGAEVVGVMLFFSRTVRPLNQPLAAILGDTGRQLGQFAARKRAEMALEAERASLARRVEERTADLSRVNAELARAVRAKDEFLANMSHELRTPLNTILALSEVLLEELRGPLNQQQQTALHSIEASGRHLLALINDILDLSKVEAGRMELHLEPIPVADLCQASLMFVKEMALKKQLQLAFQLNDQLAMMEADQKRLKQILVNLLSNAVKFTPPGGSVSLEVEVRPAAGCITFAVQDSGIGIAPEDQRRLFRPFTQLDSSLRRQHEGTGLGLALVWRLAELHGGSISLESAPDQGSRFTFTLPYQPPAHAASAPSAAAASRDGAGQGPALIIDDSESATEQLARYLQSMSLPVVTLSGGADTLEQAAALRPRLILLDLLLPAPSGWEILAALKRDPRTRATPVIIVSVVDEQSRAMAAGAAAYLVKPVARDAVRAAVLVALPEQRRAEAARPAAPQRPAVGAGARVLLAEDNESNIQVFGDYLRDSGYQVTVARNGREALERAAEARPDILLLDIQMPEVDGLEVARHLRADASFDGMPILALTALAMPGDRERCLAAGADDYMTKPISLRALGETMRRLLGA